MLWIEVEEKENLWTLQSETFREKEDVRIGIDHVPSNSQTVLSISEDTHSECNACNHMFQNNACKHNLLLNTRVYLKYPC